MIYPRFQHLRFYMSRYTKDQYNDRLIFPMFARDGLSDFAYRFPQRLVTDD